MKISITPTEAFYLFERLTTSPIVDQSHHDSLLLKIRTSINEILEEVEHETAVENYKKWSYDQRSKIDDLSKLEERKSFVRKQK